MSYNHDTKHDSPYLRRRRRADQLRAQLLAALDAASTPMSTTELREQLSNQIGRPIVIETIYRALAVLAARGEIHRVPTRGRRNIHWDRN